MSTSTLETAAARLAERLRSCPSDGIVERLEERTHRAKELRSQMTNDWDACHVAIEELIQDVVAKRQRMYKAALDLVKGLEGLTPSLERIATDVAGACDDAEAALHVVVERCTALQAAVDTEVQRWAEQAGGFIVGVLEEKGQALARAQEVLAGVIRTELRNELDQQQELAGKFETQASKVAPAGTNVLNASYEEWAVRVAQVVALAQREGSARVPAHGESAVAAALAAGASAQQPAFDGVQGTLESARDALNALTGVVEGLAERSDTDLPAVEGAIAQVAEAAGTASRELTDSLRRLHVFASGMLA